MSNRNYENPVVDDSAEIVEDATVTETEAVEEVAEVFGVVTDCLRLNIREEPAKNSAVVTIVTCLDELKIDLDNSTDDWYAVCTASGVEGFCMKKFVAVRQ